MSGPERPRFPREAATHEDALTYYRNRATQLLCTDWLREGDPELLPWGVHVQLRRGDDVFHSLFVLRDHTGRGHLKRWRADHPDARFVVMDACAAVTTWLDHKQVAYVVAEPFSGVEYKAIEQFYGDRVAKRSGAWLMNHVDEGLFVLKQLGASEAAMRAYCLHPLLQGDDDLVRSYAEGLHRRVDPDALVLALEYRQFANRHLSRHRVATPSHIALSPLLEVFHLLVADKVQNRKDFERHHASTHPDGARLKAYFHEWFDRLGIAEGRYHELCAEIDRRTQG